MEGTRHPGNTDVTQRATDGGKGALEGEVYCYLFS